ncbi:hypothetical protein G9A89_014937 [Geosiphon pyriformis]|nr:hypothetical protein G9A89_014937 [Geosiphon pyriformis]
MDQFYRVNKDVNIVNHDAPCMMVAHGSALRFCYKPSIFLASIAVIKKTAKVSGSSDGFRPVLLRKKRRNSILENDFGNGNVGLSVQGNHSWSSKTGNTTKSKNIDIEEKCLVKETSFNYGSKVKTKKTLGKPLGKIDFLPSSDDNDVLLDVSLMLPPSAKNLVNVSVRKFFVLDIGLNTVVGKSSREKLLVIKNLFSKINGFGEAFTLSKFAEIVRVTFTFKLSLIKATKLAADMKILVNTDLKKLFGHSDWAVILKEIPVGTSTEAVRVALSSFGVVVSIKIQLVGLWQKTVVEFSKSEQADLVAVCWSILIGKNAVCVTRTDQNKESWDSKDQHKALLYTLPMKITAHDI